MSFLLLLSLSAAAGVRFLTLQVCKFMNRHLAINLNVFFCYIFSFFFGAFVEIRVPKLLNISFQK